MPGYNERMVKTMSTNVSLSDATHNSKNTETGEKPINRILAGAELIASGVDGEEVIAQLFPNHEWDISEEEKKTMDHIFLRRTIISLLREGGMWEEEACALIRHYDCTF